MRHLSKIIAHDVKLAYDRCLVIELVATDSCFKGTVLKFLSFLGFSIFKIDAVDIVPDAFRLFFEFFELGSRHSS